MTHRIQSGTWFRKDVELVAPRIFYDGVPASPRDARLFAECLVMREALILDLFEDECSAVAYRRALLSLREIDAKAYSNSVKDFYKALTEEEFLRTGDWQIFKQSVAAVPQWYVAPPLRYLRGNESVPLEVIFGKFLQWAKFDSKLNFTGTSVYPEAVAYLDDEAQMRTEPVDYEVLRALRRILLEWLATFPDEATPFEGKHSSGAVTGLPKRLSTPQRKTKKLRLTPSLQRYIRYRCFNTHPFRLLDDDPTTEIEVKTCRDIDVPIDVIFVPKNPLTRRVVSPEDAAHMFCQSDAAEMIVPWLNSFHWCDLTDQSKPRRMCLRGSATGDYTTVDSSKASDFVRVSHVDFIANGTPIFPLLNYTRSRFARVEVPASGGEPEREVIIELEKFAPMGSKTCFLMEELMFALCCELAVQRTSGRRSREGDFFVYGDDVVIRTEFYPSLRFIMSLLRFRVNDDKTFHEGGRLIFREACGLFAVNGVDVTPFQVSRRYSGIDDMLESIKERKSVGLRIPEAAKAMAVIDSWNRLLLFGLKNVRRWSMAQCKNDWTRLLYRVGLREFLEDEERIEHGLPMIGRRPTPFVLTYDHVDCNFQLPKKMGKWKKQPTWVVHQEHLEIHARVNEKEESHRDDDLAYFHLRSTQHAATMEEDRDRKRIDLFIYGAGEWLHLLQTEFDRPASMSFCSRPGLVWRRGR